MNSLRFLSVVQPLFPNQRRDERVFVFSRRHPIDFLPFIFIIIALILIPMLAGAIGSTFSTYSFANASVPTKDIIILIGLIYYCFLTVFSLVSWISFYYNVFVVTDERIVEISQQGMFSRNVFELSFEQIEDVSFRTSGILNTLFDSGDIEIETAGAARNFYIRHIPRAEAAVEIINELSHQAREGKSMHSRYPELATIGLINGKLIGKDAEKPKVMNLDADLSVGVNQVCRRVPPRNLREKFDYWWWNHCSKTIVTFGSQDQRVESKEGEKEER